MNFVDFFMVNLSIGTRIFFGVMGLLGGSSQSVDTRLTYIFFVETLSTVCSGRFTEPINITVRIMWSQNCWFGDPILRKTESKYPLYGCFLKWWYPQNTPKWSSLVGKPPYKRVPWFLVSVRLGSSRSRLPIQRFGPPSFAMPVTTPAAGMPSMLTQPGAIKGGPLPVING